LKYKGGTGLEKMEKLKFVALQSIVEPGFWNRMTKLKLDEWKLQEDEQPINWSYEISKNFIRFEHDSLAFDKNRPNGFLKNFNTLDNYKQFDKKKALENKLSTVRAKIDDGSWTENDLFQPFLICFADLKKYHYYYCVN
jgi:ubiquitin-like modifier-activating enzyme ATG7